MKVLLARKAKRRLSVFRPTCPDTQRRGRSAALVPAAGTIAGQLTCKGRLTPPPPRAAVLNSMMQPLSPLVAEVSLSVPLHEPQEAGCILRTVSGQH